MRPRTTMTCLLLLAALALLLVAPAAHAWQNTGSGTSVQAWLLRQANALAEARGADWVDMDVALAAADDPDTVYRDFAYHFYDRWGKTGGRAPSRVAEQYLRFDRAVIARDYTSASRALGLLAHYYSDICNPLHTDSSRGERRMHARYELRVQRLLGRSSERLLGRSSERLLVSVRDADPVVVDATTVKSMAVTAARRAHRDYTRLVREFNAHGYSAATGDVTARSLKRAVQGIAGVIMHGKKHKDAAAPTPKPTPSPSSATPTPSTTTPAPTPTPSTSATPSETPTPTATLTFSPSPTPSATPTPPPPTPSGAVSVKDYGAKADGASDDTSAILAAVKAAVASGKEAYVPAGVYRTGTLTLPAGATLRGDGDGSWLTGLVRFNSDVTVRDVKLGGKATTFVVAPAKYTVENVRFEGVRFRGGDPTGASHAAIFAVNGGNIDGLYIDRCEFERNLGVWDANGSAGALALACDTGYGNVLKDIWITNSHFGVSNGKATGQPTFNIVFWQSEEAGTGWWGDAHIIGNVFETTAEFNLDFDGLWARDNGHNDVEIRDNLIKGAGLYHDGVAPSWPYGICVEPSRKGTVIEGNTFWRSRVSAMKFTKDASGSVFRNNIIDYRVDNGVSLYYKDFYRTISVFEGCLGNSVTGNTIYLPAGTRSAGVIANQGGSTNTVSGNTIQ